jgi:hypothetical protein
LTNQTYQNKNNKTRKNHLSNVKSQLRIYDCMTPKVVSKMFHEFQNGKNSDFVERIQEKRVQDSMIDKSIKITPKISSDSKHIYLNYKKGNEKDMHYSIHLCPNILTTQNGPMHMKLNGVDNDSGIPIHVYRDNTTPSKIRVELGTEFGQPISSYYKKETKYIVESLNDFFNEAAQNSSQIPLHKNAQRIHQNIQTALRKYNKTQRRKYRRTSTKRI